MALHSRAWPTSTNTSLRIARRIPLRPDGRGATAFDLLSIEFLRDDGRLCGSADAYFPREFDPPPDFVETAVMLGSGSRTGC